MILLVKFNQHLIGQQTNRHLLFNIIWDFGPPKIAPNVKANWFDCMRLVIDSRVLRICFTDTSSCSPLEDWY